MAFRLKRRHAHRTGNQLCATLAPDGEPVYFEMPSEASDEEVRQAAFAVRYGRKMSSTEQSLIRLAEARAHRHQ
jgi:hypothetical protein